MPVTDRTNALVNPAGRATLARHVHLYTLSIGEGAVVPEAGLVDLVLGIDCSPQRVGWSEVRGVSWLRASAAGRKDPRLAVTEGNAAEGLYRRLGFRLVYSRRKLAIPLRPRPTDCR